MHLPAVPIPPILPSTTDELPGGGHHPIIRLMVAFIPFFALMATIRVTTPLGGQLSPA